MIDALTIDAWQEEKNKKAAKKLRAKAKFDKKGKGRGRGKGKGKGRGKSKGKGKRKQQAEPELIDEPPVKRRLSFEGARGSDLCTSAGDPVDAAPAAEGNGAEPEPAAVAEQVCPGSSSDAVEQVKRHDAVEPSVQMNPGDHAEDHASKFEDMEQLRADKATPLTPAMESSCASSSAQQAEMMMVPHDGGDGDCGDAIVELEGTSGSKSSKMRGPTVHHSPATLSSIAPPGCSIILNRVLVERNSNTILCFVFVVVSKLDVEIRD